MVIEGLSPNYGDIAPIARYLELKKRYCFRIVLVSFLFVFIVFCFKLVLFSPLSRMTLLVLVLWVLVVLERLSI